MISQKKPDKQTEISILLHNIRSTHNVGSIFRTADAVGVEKIYISGYTPSPVDRFGRDRKDISKSSLGAEKTVKWENVENPHDLIKNLKKNNFFVCSVEQNKKSIDFKKIPKVSKILLIFGNEVLGVDDELLKISDAIAEIRMYGKKESLNVSVAVGVILYSLR